MLRWLLIAGLLAGGCGVGVDRYVHPTASGMRQFHDYSACGGGLNIPTEGTDHCMTTRGYAVKP